MTDFDPENAVPVTILTGYLGSGKTTLLNRILKGDHGLKVAVLVNDFGAINIDSELVVGVEDEMISLANGCVCCEIRDDLIEAIDDLLKRVDAIDYVLLEASGVADPSSIFATFSEDKYSRRIRVDSITCVVDTDQVLEGVSQAPLAQLKQRQMGFADLLILNKTDLAGREKTAEVRSWIEADLNRIRIIEAQYCRIPLEILLAVGRFDPSRQVPEHSHQRRHDHREGTDGHDRSHDDDFQRWSFETDEPLSIERLREMIRRRLPGGVYRCKGFVNSEEHPHGRSVLQVVGRRFDVTDGGPWNDGQPMTRIVAIGERGKVDERELQNLFEQCIASRPAPDRAIQHDGYKVVRI
ncbi:MAG: GTP-binding protein [bacterium]|nr:GTP-binding protein [bacterium]